MKVGKLTGIQLAGLFVYSMLAFPVFAVAPLSLKAATKLAVENNKDLKAARYNVLLAASRFKQAGLWANPNLQINTSDDRFFTNEGEYTRSIGFTQAFPVSGRINKQKNVARVDIALAMAEIRNAKRQLRGQVAENFYALLITDARLKQLKKLLSINQQLMQVSQKRFYAAEVSELDANTAKLEYQRLLQEKQALTSLRINQQAQLNLLLGRERQTPLLPSKSLPKLAGLPPLTALQRHALQQRPEMQIAWLNFTRAQADAQLARRERWADWTIGLAVQQEKIAVEGAPLQKPDRALNVNISIPLPLINKNQGRIMETKLQGTKNLMTIKALKLAIRNEVASNYGQVNALYIALQQLQTGNTLKLVTRNVNLAREAYQNGQISLLEVLQIQRQQNELQTSQLNVLEKYLQAVVKLCTALGNNRISLCSPFSGKRTLNVFVHREIS